MADPIPEERDTPESALLPCPCCGGPAEIGQLPFEEESPDAGGYFVRCMNEGCLIGMGLRFACGDDPRPELIAAWNRRADADALARLAGAEAEAERASASGVREAALEEAAQVLDLMDQTLEDKAVAAGAAEMTVWGEGYVAALRSGARMIRRLAALASPAPVEEAS